MVSRFHHNKIFIKLGIKSTNFVNAENRLKKTSFANIILFYLKSEYRAPELTRIS